MVSLDKGAEGGGNLTVIRVFPAHTKEEDERKNVWKTLEKVATKRTGVTAQIL